MPAPEIDLFSTRRQFITDSLEVVTLSKTGETVSVSPEVKRKMELGVFNFWRRNK